MQLLRRVGAVVHLAEPAETADLRGSEKRAKGDRANARHLKELLMIKRLPDSCIAPERLPIRTRPHPTRLVVRQTYQSN